MRGLVAGFMALCLVGLPAIAGARGAGGEGNPAPAKATTASTANSSDAPAAAAKTDSPAKPAESSLESELDQLRDLMEAQAKQIQEQSDQLKQQQQQMQELESKLSASSSASSPHPAVAITSSSSIVPRASESPVVTAISTSVAPAGTTAVVGIGNPVTSNSAAPNQNPPADQPTSWNFKGVTFTPGGFFAAETVWRQRGLGADVNTPFNSLPMPGSSSYNISEFNASGRQSRIAMLVQGKLKTVTFGGYYEADFLSAGTTSNDNQSNSYTLRQRQFWGQAAFTNGWTFTGGQMWSLVTQTAKGLDNRTEVLPETIDAQYHIGFSWSRQYGVRLVKNFNNKMWVGFSVEEPQITFKQAGTTVPFLFGSAGTGGGLYNLTANYSFNMTPDFVFKAAFEPGFGHYELFGLISTFRDRIFPTGAAPHNSNVIGGGGGGNAWFPFDHSHINLGFHALVGNGVGRYGSAQSAPDVTTQPDGTFALVRSYQGLFTLAFHYTKWDVYLNAGEEYGDRTQFISGTTTIPNEGFGAIGFNNAGCWTEGNPGSGGYAAGALANCSNNIRNLVEGTAGLWYSFYTGPKGTFKFGLQYSREAYNTWKAVGATGTCTNASHPSCGPSTNENMFFTSFRYYIP